LPEGEIALNNRSPQPTEVTLVFHSRNGNPSDPIAVALKPAEIKHIDLDDLLPGNLKHQSELGGLFVQYTGQWNQVAAQLTLVSEHRKGSMDENLRPDTDFLSGVQDAVWYWPANGDATVALGNTTDTDLSVFLEAPGQRRRELNLRPHETEIVRLHREDDRNADLDARAFSVSLETSAPPGALRAVGYVTFSKGYARTIRFYDRATVRQPDLFAANLSTENSEIQIALKNIGDKPIAATPRFIPVGPGAGTPFELPVVSLSPGEAKIVDSKPLQELAAQNPAYSRVGVHIRNSGEKGTLIGSLASLNFQQDVSYEIPLRDSGSIRNSGGSYPIRLDDDYSTFVTLMNVSNDPVQFTGIIRHKSGDYVFKPQKLAPGESVVFDIKDLRDRQVPDPNRKTLPKDFQRGQFNWSMHLGGDVPRMIGRSQIVSPSRGISASYSCPVCCPDSGPHFIFNPWTLLMIPGGFQLFATMDQSISCYGGITPWPSSRPLTSANPTVADSNYTDPEQGQAQGNGHAPGGTAQAPEPNLVDDYMNDGMDCYYYPYWEQNWQSMAVQPTISGPNTVWYFAGQNPSGYATQITLTSSGGSGTTWTIVSGSDKVTLSTTTGAQTSITSSGSAFSSAVGDIKIKATANGVDSQPFSITSRTPYRLVQGTIQTQCESTWGYETQINYTIQDQLLTTLPSGVPANENWTTAVVNDYSGTNWRRGPPNGFSLSGASFTDVIQGEQTSLPPNPVPSCTGPSTAVQHWGQEFRVGSTTIGVGKRVQTNTLKKFLNHAEHQQIVSPAP
jgi:hypothetical protein